MAPKKTQVFNENISKKPRKNHPWYLSKEKNLIKKFKISKIDRSKVKLVLVLRLFSKKLVVTKLNYCFLYKQRSLYSAD